MSNVCMWIKKKQVEGRRKQIGCSRAARRKEAARRQPVNKRRREESIRRTWSELTTF